MLMAFFKSGNFTSMTSFEFVRALFMLQMYVTGFVTVVLTPMRGPDVALGRTDALHCYAAMIYVVDHAVAYEFFLGVGLFTTNYGLGFVTTSMLCGLCQFLRANDDHAAKIVHTRLIGNWMSLKTLIHVLELGFMLFENALFFVFLFGMTSGVEII